MRSALKWIGGKNLLAPEIIKRFPKHNCYVEPFCGGCNVILQKGPSKVEIVNDANADLVNFLLVLKEWPEKLYHECEALPYSQYLYEKWKWGKLPKDDLERAVRFFYIVRSGFSSGGHKHKTGWSCGKTVDKASSYRSAVKLIKDMAERMKLVNIACEDFEKVINSYDGPDTFFYCDPPYVGHEELYQCGFKKGDHQRLANILNNIKGRAMISYYEEPLIDQLYPGWNKEKFIRSSTIRNIGDGEKLPRRTELLLTNYIEGRNMVLFEQEVGS